MWQEFKKFIMRGNVIDLAIAVVIGAAFSSITNSLVADIVTPPLGLLTGGVDFSNLGIVLGPNEYADTAAAIAAGAPVIKYGVFINAVINFLLVALAMFGIVKFVSRIEQLTREEEGAPPPSATPENILLLREIRDLMAAQNGADQSAS